MQINRLKYHAQRVAAAFNLSATSPARLRSCPIGSSHGFKKPWLGLILLLLVPGIGLAAGKTELKSEAEKINYSVGYQIGGDFQAQKIELAPEVFVQGIRDALDKKNQPLLTQDEMNKTLMDLKAKLVAEEKQQLQQAVAQSRNASETFLKENAKKEGVTVLPSGVQYKILAAGSGAKPTLKDTVTIKYRVTRINGQEIAKTEGNTTKSYPVNQALHGLQEVLPLMAEGAKWQIFLPAASAVGGVTDPLDNLEAMIFEIELISVLPAK